VSSPLTVRDAGPGDAVAIARVARASWRETYRDIFEPAFIGDFLSRAYDEDGLARAAATAARRPFAERARAGLLRPQRFRDRWRVETPDCDMTLRRTVAEG